VRGTFSRTQHQRRGGRDAEVPALNQLISQESAKPNPASADGEVDARATSGRWKVSAAAETGSTGKEHGDQATTKSHDADCGLLHDYSPQIFVPIAVISD